MLRLPSLFAMVAFIAWIMPLGAFIQTSQEKTACDGKRAMHMCSMMKGAVQKQGPSGISYQNAANSEKSAKSSTGASGDDFLIKNRKIIFQNSRSAFPEIALIIPPNPSLHLLDAVPKVRF